MKLRALLLRVMFWTLAVGAVLGAISILAGGSSTMGRITATTFGTAAAVGLMIPLLRLGEKQPLHAASVLGIGVISLEFVVMLALIWDIPEMALPGLSIDEELGLSMLFLGLCTVPAMFLMRMRHFGPALIASHAGLVLVGAVFVSLICGTWSDDFFSWSASSRVSEHWFVTAGILSSMGVFLVGSLVNIRDVSRETAIATAFRATGVLCGVAAAAIFIVANWYELNGDSRVVVALTTTAVIVAHMNLCGMVPLRGFQIGVRLATFAALLLTGVLVNVDMDLTNRFAFSNDIVARMMGASGVVAACGTLAIAVLAAMNRRSSAPRELTEVTQVTIVCPGCDKKQTLPVGESDCPTCRLHFRLAVEEPRCPHCDYLIYRLTSDRCPECGMALGDPPTKPVPAAPIAPTRAAGGLGVLPAV